MNRNNQEKKRAQCGEVMIEASFILVSVIILLMALLGISFLFYQQALMTTVANEMAADIAKNYKFPEMDMGEDTITLNHANTAGMFRMSFGKSNMEDAHVQRAEEYAEWRIVAASLGLDAEDVEIVCDIKSTGIGRAYVKVTVAQESDYFLSGFLQYLGMAEDDMTFSATAYAECSDLMSYTSMVNFTNYVASVMDEPLGGFGGLYTSVRDFVLELID